jgi:dolichol-phosphate mannosyltransferase
MNLIDIFIPAFDEMENLKVLLPRIKNEIGKIQPYAFRVNVIVRSNESQSHVSQIEAMSVNVIRRSPKDNFGSAINTAIREIDVSTKYVILMDADGSHNPARIVALVDTIATNRADIVIASRYMKGGRTDNSFVLVLLSKVLNKIFALVIGVNCRDISTNYKIYDASLLRGVHLKCANFDVIEELLFILISKRQGRAVILEIPDHFERRKFGESKRKVSLFIFSYVITLLKLRVRLIRESANSR